MSFVSGIMASMMRRDNEMRRITDLKHELQNAEVRGLDCCVNCGWCCSIRTCVPTPDELEGIAKHLELTPAECINKYFAVDSANGGEPYYVKPVGMNIKDLAGKFIPHDRTYNEGACVFLTEDKKCSIYQVKPQNATETECWTEDDPDSPIPSWSDKALLERFGIDGAELEDYADEDW